MATRTATDGFGEDDAQAATAERARLAEFLEVDDLKWLMSNKRGRRVVARWLDRAGVWRLSFSPDAAVTAFNEGQRNGGLRLLAQVTRHCPERYAEMLREQTE